MSFATWSRAAWVYHVLFAFAVTWPGQTLVNAPAPFVLGLPRQMAWIAAWLVGSLFVLWRMDAARGRAKPERSEAKRSEADLAARADEPGPDRGRTRHAPQGGRRG